MSFEVFERPQGLKSRGDAVTITNTGQLRLSKSLINGNMSDVEYVILMFDRDSRRIALKPSDSTVAYAHRLSNSSGGKQVSAVQFFKTYGIELAETSLRLGCHWDNELGAWVVDPIPAEALDRD